jgi:imidazolonepropionase-like amidohydrolase
MSTPLRVWWRRHSCLLGRDSSRPRFLTAPRRVSARQTKSLRHGFNATTLAGLFAVSLAAATPPIVIQNATILTVTKGTLNGSVLIRDGKIAEVGERVTVPSDAKVIDASGQFLMPGIIDCHSHIAADSINEGSVSVSSMVGIEDVLNPDDISIYRAVAGGVTTANILHGSANSIGGKCTVIKLRWGKDAHDMIFEGAMPGIKFALGENPKRAGNPTGQRIGAGNVQGRYPATRMGVEDVIREAFNEAKEYQQSWKDYKQKIARGEQATAPRRDLKLEPLVEVLEGKRLVHAHCYRADEILMLLRVADDYGFKICTLQHVLEGYKVAKEIAAHGAGASTFSDWWAYKLEAFDAIPYNAAIMMRKGIIVSLNSDSDELMRHLNDEAAKTIKYGGLNETEALSLITINPAKQLKIDKRVGSIEVGKDADLTIFDKHPLSNYAKVEKVFIDGQMYFDRSSDLAERPERDTEKKKLLDKEKEEQKKNGPAGRGRPAA